MHDIGKIVFVLAITILISMMVAVVCVQAVDIESNGTVNNDVNETIQLNNDVKESVNEVKNDVVQVNDDKKLNVLKANSNDELKEVVKVNDDGSSTATIRLIDSAGNVLISYDKKLVKGQSWTIQENNVANRIGHIQSDNGGLVNPSTKGARYVKGGHTYSILGYSSEFPVKVTATGEDYTVDILLNVEQIDCQITLTYVDNVTGEVIRSTTNNILKGDSWTVEQTQFDNVVSNRLNITVDDRNYTFSSFNTTAPLTMTWQPDDYEVVVCLNYDEVIPEPVNDTTNNDTNETTNSTNTTNDTIDDKQPVNTTDEMTSDDSPVVNDSTTILKGNELEDNTTPIPMLKTGANLKNVICIMVFLGFCLLMISGWREEK